MSKMCEFLFLFLKSGKLKGMMPAILSIGERLQRKMSIAVEENKPIEIKDLTIRYTCKNIAPTNLKLILPADQE